jgi:homocitrate synthase NifV
LRELTDEAAASFGYVTVGAQDASRADRCFLMDFCHAVAETPAIRVRLADTVGVLTPKMAEIIATNSAKAMKGKLVEIHAHNDLGMATANTISAWQAGAICLSTTINGIGERAGNASFAEVAAALHVACRASGGIDLSGLCDLATYVSSVTRRALPVETPITGEAVFSHSSGIHLAGLTRDPLAYEAFPPELVGHSPSRHFFGSQSGTGALRDFAMRCGLSLDPAALPEVAERLREFCRVHRTMLDPAEAVRLAVANV